MTEKSSTIEVAARDLIQLFNSLDPSPFPERDLDDEAEAFIVSWAKELSPTDCFRIVIHLPMPELIKAEQQGLRKACLGTAERGNTRSLTIFGAARRREFQFSIAPAPS